MLSDWSCLVVVVLVIRIDGHWGPNRPSHNSDLLASILSHNIRTPPRPFMLTHLILRESRNTMTVSSKSGVSVDHELAIRLSKNSIILGVVQ